MCAFFWKILFLGGAIGGLDVLEYFYAYRTYAAKAIQAGRLPLWNPDHFGGAPFLANIQNSVFYPPTALFYVLDFPTAYTWSVALHAFLGALLAYLFARHSLALGRVGALVGAMAFAFGGFLGGQMGHLNQLSAAIWLPALLLCWDKAVSGRLLYVVAGAVVVGLQFLAGHTQESYLMVVALLLYAAVGTALRIRDRGWGVMPSDVLTMAVILALGAALAAVQLVPTAELTSWSIRANGLSYQEATTFSLKGPMLLNSLLPPFGNRSLLLEPGGSEFLGYVSVTGLVLALAGLAYGTRRHVVFFAGLAALSLFLAIGQFNPLYPTLFKLVPGLNLFRVPARWLFLYSFAVAMLAGLGADALAAGSSKLPWRRFTALVVLFGACGMALSRQSSFPPAGTWGAWVGLGASSLALTAVALRLRGRADIRGPLGAAAATLIAAELWFAGLSLDSNHPTVPDLFERRLATLDFLQAQPRGFRAVSVARDTFVPAEEAALRQRFGPALGGADLFAFLSYYKLREILEPNTCMAVDLPSIDGYDGGLLPLARYVRFKDLLTERPSAPDDRVRFVVKWLPNRGLLDLAGVRYVLMDRLSDKEGYDLSSFIRSGEKLQLARPVRATSASIVAALRSRATVTLADAEGQRQEITIQPGGTPVGQLPYALELPTFATTVRLPQAMMVTSVTLDGDAFLNGLALIDEQAGSSFSPLVAPGLELRRAFEGDVKIYENLNALPPAFLAHEAQLAPDAEHAAAAMGGDVDYGRQAIVEADAQPAASSSLLGRALRRLRRLTVGQAPFEVPPAWLEPQPPEPGAALDRLAFDDYRPESIVVRTESDRPGFLVLTQSFYPGWQATIDGAPAHIMPADLLFQAVHVPSGRHRVEFSFRPRSLALGAAISLAGVFVCLVGLALAWMGRRRPT